MENRLTNFSREEPKAVTYKKRHLLSIYLFATILTSYRVRIGLTQARLGRKSRVSVASIQRIERGDGWVLIPTARKLARALNIPLDSLMQAPHDITSANDPRLARSIAHDISETMRGDTNRQPGQVNDYSKAPSAVAWTSKADSSESVMTEEDVNRKLARLMGSA